MDKDAKGKGKGGVIVVIVVLEATVWFGWLAPATNRRRKTWHVVLENTNALGKSQYETIFTIVSSQSSSKGVLLEVLIVIVMVTQRSRCF
jgi:hypothetical protein